MTPEEARIEIARLLTRNDCAEPICNWANCEYADIDDDGDVWIEGPQTGHWLDDDKLVKLAAWLVQQRANYAYPFQR
jgi:hypothetical protein